MLSDLPGFEEAPAHQIGDCAQEDGQNESEGETSSDKQEPDRLLGFVRDLGCLGDLIFVLESGLRGLELDLRRADTIRELVVLARRVFEFLDGDAVGDVVPGSDADWGRRGFLALPVATARLGERGSLGRLARSASRAAIWLSSKRSSLRSEVSCGGSTSAASSLRSLAITSGCAEA